MRDNILNIRATGDTKQLLQQAANMLGTTVSAFVMSCATEKAHELLNKQQHFILSDIEWKALIQVLDESPQSQNKKLQTLLREPEIFAGE